MMGMCKLMPCSIVLMTTPIGRPAYLSKIDVLRGRRLLNAFLLPISPRRVVTDAFARWNIIQSVQPCPRGMT